MASLQGQEQKESEFKVEIYETFNKRTFQDIFKSSGLTALREYNETFPALIGTVISYPKVFFALTDLE